MKCTRDVAQELNISAAALRHHISAGHIATPKRRVGILFLWNLEEIEAARKVLSEPGRRRPRYVAMALREKGNPNV